MKDRKKAGLIVGILIMAVIYILLYVGIAGVLKQKINTTNLLAYFIFSLIIGIIGGIYIFLKLMPAFWCFMSGVIIGLTQMYRMFEKGMDGFADLTGLVSMIMYIVIGFVIGILAQLIHYFYTMYKKRKMR